MVLSAFSVYVLMTVMVFIWLNQVIINNLPFMKENDRKTFDDLRVRFISLLAVASLWFVTVPIIIRNSKRGG